MVILDIRYGDEDYQHILIYIENNKTFKELKEEICPIIGMDKNNILIIKNSSKNNNDYWEVMNDNNIIDFIRREPDSLVIYTLEEYSLLCKDTISVTDSDTDSMYDFDCYSD